VAFAAAVHACADTRNCLTHGLKLVSSHDKPQENETLIFSQQENGGNAYRGNQERIGRGQTRRGVLN
jgi:hypothetical protein